MRAEKDYSDGSVVIRATAEEAALIAEGLYAVEDTGRRLAQDDDADIDECDRDSLMDEARLLGAMRADVERAIEDRGLTLV